MSESNSAVKTTIIVALIGLFGTLITVLINNWDKVFPSGKASNSPANTQVKDKSTTEGSRTSEGNNAVDYQSLAEKMTSDFIAAFKSRDVTALVTMVSFPFYNDHDILTSPADVRNRFEKNFLEKGPMQIEHCRPVIMILAV